MEHSLSVQIVWSIATQEAIIAAFKFIEPPHLLLSVIKFAELKEQQFEMFLKDRSETMTLITQRNEVRSKLAEYCMPVPEVSKTIRYSLRQRMGKGNYSHYQQRIKQPSEATWEIYREAEVVAKDVNSNQVRAEHLLEALLKKPSFEINDVLNGSGIRRPKFISHTPYLDRYGWDISANIRKQTEKKDPSISSEVEKDPVCKVLLDDLFSVEKNNIIMIQDAVRSPKEIIETVAAYLIGNTTLKGAGNLRIVELNLFSQDTESDSITGDLFSLTEEISAVRNIVIFLDKFHQFFSTSADQSFRAMIIDLLSQKDIQCIAGTDKKNHLAYVAKNRQLSKLLRPIWIHDLSIPDQL